jgi:hypothetical protein
LVMARPHLDEAATGVESRVESGVESVIRSHPRMAGFNLAYLIVFFALGMAWDPGLAVAYSLIVIGLGLLLAKLEARFGLGVGMLWAASALGLAHMAGGLLPVDDDRTLYFAWLVPDLLRYDQLVHAFGAGCATLVCGTVLRHWVHNPRVTVGPAVFMVLAGTGAAALGEVAEFLATRVATVNVGGYANTGWDLFFNLVGAAVAALGLARWSRLSVPETTEVAPDVAHRPLGSAG